MKNKIYLLLLILLYVPAQNLYAKEELTDSNISGHVLLSGNGEHLPFITVSLKGTNLGTVTDRTGHYFLKNLPVGRYTIEASGVGYVTDKKEINIEKGKSVEVNFSLSEDITELEQVVVSASRSELKRQNSSSLVSVLTSKVFDVSGATTLSEGLSYQPGVRVEDNCQNCGFMQVRINGLDGHYSQILMDSRPVFSALTGVYGLEQIPANMIDRVEIVRGGGSALFGSSAIGGTINIITKEPSENYAEIAHSLTTIGVSSALDNNTTVNASVVTDNNMAGIMLYGQSRNRNPYDADGDGFSEIPLLNGKTIGLRSFLKTGNFGKINVQYHGISELRRGGDSLDRPPHEAEIAEQTDHTINGGELSYDLHFRDFRDKINIFTSFQKTKRASYYGAGRDPNAYGHTDDLVSVSGVQYIHKWDKLWFLPAEIVAGAEYNHNNLTDEFTGYEHYVNQRVKIVSAYLQNEWRNDKWGFLVGVRMDKHNLVHKPIFSPRVNFRYNPNRGLNFRLSYSSGFRAPQAFDEDFHIAVVGGNRVVTVLVPDLKEERSNSISLSADMYKTFGRVRTNLMVELFYTDLKDAFAIRKTGEKDEKGNTVLERYNGSGSRVAGVNIEGKIGLFPQFQLQGSATVQYSRHKQDEYWSEDPGVGPERMIFRSPAVYGYLMCIYNPLKELTISSTAVATGSMLVQHLAGSGTLVDRAVMTPAFFDMNFKVAYDFRVWRSVTLQVSAAVLNIFNAYQTDFDQGPGRDSGYVYGPALPRSIAVGLKLSI